MTTGWFPEHRQDWKRRKLGDRRGAAGRETIINVARCHDLGRQNRSSESANKDGDDRSYIRAIDLPLRKQTDNAALFRRPVMMMQQFMQGRTDGQCGGGEDQGGQHDRQDRLRGAAPWACCSVKFHDLESTTPTGMPQVSIRYELCILKRGPLSGIKPEMSSFWLSGVGCAIALCFVLKGSRRGSR